MPADSSIFQQYLQPVRSVQDYGADLDKRNLLALQLQGQQGQNALLDITRQQQAEAARQGIEKQRAMSAIYADPRFRDPLAREDAMVNDARLAADGYAARKARLENESQVATASEKKSVAEKNRQATAEAQRKAGVAQVLQYNGPGDAIAHIDSAVLDGSMPAPIGDALRKVISTDPKWQLRLALGIQDPTKMAEMLMPHLQTVNAGDFHVQQAVEPMTGKITETGRTAIKQSSDNAANNATSRANNRDTQSGENLRAGVLPGGGLDANSEATAQAIAKGQFPAPMGIALLNPKNQRIVGRVMEINPDYDASTVSAKRTAAVAFTSGQLGNALRSVSTANAHLDQLGEMADALNNGNTQVVNRVTNWYKAQTGQPAPTSFDAIKNVVGQEVVKAIVAGGGGVGEREEAAKSFSSANSPAQLKSVIQHYRMIMGAQADNLLAQRDAAGLPRSTLPKYNVDAALANAHPAAGAAPKVVNFSDLK